MSLSSFNPQGPAEVFPGMFNVPNGGLISYVHSSGAAGLDLLPPGMAAPSPGGFYTSINQALLSSTRSGRGDTIVCLPGHAESVSSADFLSGLGTKTDITIVGMGAGLSKPSLTWTTNGSSILFDQNNFRMRNFQMFLAGPQVNGTAQTTLAPITISAAGWEISNCDIWWGFDADQIVNIGITTTAAADFGKFNRNYCFAETAAVPTTTFLRITGCDQMEMDGTMIIGPGSTTAIGPVQMLTTGSKGMRINNSIIQSTLAGSTLAFTAIAGCTGFVTNCDLGVLAAGNGITAASGLQVAGTYVAVAGAAGTLATG